MDNKNTIEERVSKLEIRVSELASLLNKNAINITEKLPNTKKLSVTEFLSTKMPHSDVQKTLAIAYYLEKYEHLNSFNVDDIKSHFRLARQPLPQNVNDKININIKKGYIMDAEEKKDSKKAWIVTNSGLEIVESGFKNKE
ncbi:MAG: hypothetical protein Q7U04_14980 [Bacteriovorax sp.]|nr:hypothetical protein [Bacteriovorax sp.]